MYASLGSIRFEGLKGFDKFDTTTSVSYAEHALIANKPTLQRTGLGLDEIGLSIQFHRQFCTPEDEIRALKQAAEQGEILPLVLGNGAVVGDFVIAGMNESVKQTTARGDLVHVVVDVQLREYFSPNRLQTKEARARLNAFALDSDNAVPIVVPPEVPTYDEKELSNVVAGMSDGAASVDGDMSKMRAFPAQSEYYSGRISEALDSVNSGISRSNSLLTNPELILKAPDLPTALENLSRLLQDFKAVDPALDFAAAQAANDAFQTGMDDVLRTSANISSSVIVRRT